MSELTNHPTCACGCGCEPDGDWHWSQQPWCRCVANNCPCVTDMRLHVCPKCQQPIRVARDPEPGYRFFHGYCVGAPVEISELPESFTCSLCGATSYNPNDIREGYCGRCHSWTVDEGGS